MSTHTKRTAGRPVLENLEGRQLFAGPGVAGLGGPVPAAQYVATDLAPDTGGVAHTGRAYGISDNGQRIAGTYDNHAAYWFNGKVVDLGFDGVATDVNDSGVVVGVDTSSGATRPFVLADGKKTAPTLNGRTNGYVAAVNNSGTYAGTFYGGGPETNVAFYGDTGGKLNALGTPAGFSGTEASGINAKGQIAGNAYSTANGYRAFLHGNGTFKTIELPGKSISRAGKGLTDAGTLAVSGPSEQPSPDGFGKIQKAYAVAGNGYATPADRGTHALASSITATDMNNSGAITADADAALAKSYALLDTGNGFARIDDLVDAADGWHFGTARGVSQNGLVVGGGFNKQGQFSPYVLTPVPVAVEAGVSGRVYEDANANGKQDAGEKNLAHVKVKLANLNGDASLVTTTDAEGLYRFENVEDGGYAVDVTLPAGYVVNPLTANLHVFEHAGSESDGRDFGLLLKPVAPATGSISGVVFNDDDKDGKFDANEKASGKRTVFLDSNGNGKLDGGEAKTESDANGKYAFNGLAAGTYKVGRVFPAGYKLSNNNQGYVTIKVSAGQNVSDVHLGSKKV